MAKEYIERNDAVEVTRHAWAKGLEPSQYIEDLPADDVVEIPSTGIGDLSDGYHTFNELYHHRAVLFAALCNLLPDRAWKSMRHHDGDMYSGMFIVGIETPAGQATYHYDVDPYWDMFDVKVLPRAPEWDGHTPSEALSRLLTLTDDVVEVVRCKDFKHWEDGWLGYCTKCHTAIPYDGFCSYGERRDNNAEND